MLSSPSRRPDSCEPHEYSDGTHVKEPASVACRIAGSVGTHPDWVRGAILLLGFMFAMTGFSFYSAWAVDRSHDLGWSSRRDTVALMRSEEHTSELQSLMRNSYAVFCLNTKIKRQYKADSTEIIIRPYQTK